jgi:hypothetical protein
MLLPVISTTPRTIRPSINMTSVQSKVHEAASQHAQLLQGLAETDQAPSQLQQQNAYLKDLKAQEESTSKRVEEDQSRAEGS